MKITYVPFDESNMKYQTDDPNALKVWTENLRKIQHILWLVPYKSGVQFELESMGNSRTKDFTDRILFPNAIFMKELFFPRS